MSGPDCWAPQPLVSPRSSSSYGEGSTKGEEREGQEKASPGPPWNSYQGLMGSLVHGGHRVTCGWLQVVKRQLDVLLGRKVGR